MGIFLSIVAMLAAVIAGIMAAEGMLWAMRPCRDETQANDEKERDGLNEEAEEELARDCRRAVFEGFLEAVRDHPGVVVVSSIDNTDPRKGEIPAKE